MSTVGGAALDRFQVIPAAYLVLRREHAGVSQVLLQLRQHTGYMDGHWACGAAGHVEQGESVVAAAVREAREELGIEVDAADLHPLTVMHRTTPGGGPIEERIDVFFACTRWVGEADLQEDKASALRWVDLARLDALDAPVVPHERHVLDLLRDGVLAPLVTYGF